MPQAALSPRASALRAACYTYLRPRLAQDAAFDLTSIALALKKGKSLAEQRPVITAAIRTAVEGKLAQDADIDDVANLLDAIEDVVDSNGVDVPDEMEHDPNLELADVDHDGREELVRDDEPDPLVAKIREFLKSVGVSDEVMSQFDQLVSSEAEPEDLDDDGIDDDQENDMNRDRRMAGDQRAGRRARAARSAMDSAQIESLVARRVEEARVNERVNARAVQAALRDVRGTVGEITLACDSAEDVYAAALGALGRPVKGIDKSAYKAMFELARDARAAARDPAVSGRRIAQDAAGSTSFAERFPAAARVRVSG